MTPYNRDVLYTGVDIVEVERVARLVDRFGQRFANRVFGADEWSRYRDRPASLAARFAAKEAVIKALGTGQIGLHEIRVVRQDGERPKVELVGRALARANELGVREVSISLSHTRAYAVAVAVAHVQPVSTEPVRVAL